MTGWLYNLFLFNNRLPIFFKLLALLSLGALLFSRLFLPASSDESGLSVAITIARGLPVLALMIVCSVLVIYAWKFANALSGAPLRKGLLRLDLDADRFRAHRLNKGDAASDSSALNPFVTFSDQEIAIALSNPSLRGKERLRLYRHWLKRSPDSFLILERLPDKDPVAVSIILSLTEEGWEQVHRKEIDIIKLQDDEIGQGASETFILIDTLIVGKGPGWWLFRRRKDHEGNLWPFLIDHLALYWRDDQPVTLIVEPDQKEVLTLCRDLGFDCETYAAKKGSTLCVLRYTGQPLPPLSTRILEKVKERSGASTPHTGNRRYPD